METGDLLLFSNKTSFWSQTIKWFTQSPYSHVGMVVRSPTWIRPDLTGTYLFESTLSNANSININPRNVVLRDLDSVIKLYQGDVYLRKLNTNRDEQFHKKFKQAFYDAHNKPYNMNPVDWIGTFFDIHNIDNMADISDYKQVQRFFCSALVAWIYIQIGCLAWSTDWLITRPCDFADNDSFCWNNLTTLDNTVIIKKYSKSNHEYINDNSLIRNLVNGLGWFITRLAPIIHIIFRPLVNLLWILIMKIYNGCRDGCRNVKM